MHEYARVCTSLHEFVEFYEFDLVQFDEFYESLWHQSNQVVSKTSDSSGCWDVFMILKMISLSTSVFGRNCGLCLRYSALFRGKCTYRASNFFAPIVRPIFALALL